MRGKNKNFFATNILQLQKYDFDSFKLDEIILLEYFFIKARAFNFQWFYYSNRRISDETGIKRTRLYQIFERFAAFLTIEKRGYPYQKQYFLNVAKFFDYQMFKLLYKTDPDPETIEFWANLKNEFLSAQGVEQKTTLTAEKFALELNSIFNRRRARFKELPKTTLAVTQKAIADLQTVLQLFDLNALKNSFLAYIDAIIENDENPDIILSYWLTRNENGDFPLINKYLDYFNQNYEVTSK